MSAAIGNAVEIAAEILFILRGTLKKKKKKKKKDKKKLNMLLPLPGILRDWPPSFVAR